MKFDVPPESWHAFLRDLDDALHRHVVLHCFGGFAILMQFGLPRPTFDVDCFTVIPVDEIDNIHTVAGLDSPLYRKHRLYLQCVGIANAPEDYERRLTEVCPNVYPHLQLLALEAHDLALSKLERNSAKDRHDVRYLAHVAHLDPKVLQDRYYNELRPYLANEERHDLTLRLWLEMLEEQRSGPPSPD